MDSQKNSRSNHSIPIVQASSISKNSKCPQLCKYINIDANEEEMINRNGEKCKEKQRPNRQIDCVCEIVGVAAGQKNDNRLEMMT